MPFYEYLCNTCKDKYKTFHGAEEKSDSCPICKSADVIKALPFVSISNKNLADNKTDSKVRVEKFIEESREALKAQREEARKEVK